MATEWRNNGEPIDGEYIADVDPEDGSQVQTFRGATVKEVADKLLAAQGNASRRINELKKTQTPDPAPKALEFKPRSLSANERFQIAGDLQDPDKVDAAINTVIEASIGGNLKEITSRLQEDDEKERIAAAVKAAQDFNQSEPDWFPIEENKVTLMGYMEQHGMAHTLNNFQIAFARLNGSGLLTRRPAAPPPPQPEPRQERIAPTQTTRPRGSVGASGIRSSDVSGTTSPKPTPKYTRQQILEMPRNVYADKMANEAGFAQFVNSMKM